LACSALQPERTHVVGRHFRTAVSFGAHQWKGPDAISGYTVRDPNVVMQAAVPHCCGAIGPTGVSCLLAAHRSAAIRPRLRSPACAFVRNSTRSHHSPCDVGDKAAEAPIERRRPRDEGKAQTVADHREPAGSQHEALAVGSGDDLAAMRPACTSQGCWSQLAAQEVSHINKDMHFFTHSAADHVASW
jgi:hypothetical protein